MTRSPANEWRRLCAAGFDARAAVRDYWNANTRSRSIRVDARPTLPGRCYAKVVLVVGDREYVIGSCLGGDRGEAVVIALLSAFTRLHADGLPIAGRRDEAAAVLSLE